VSRADELPLQPTRLHLPSTVIKDRPRRLDRIFSRAPVFFITFRTRDRKRIDPLISANNAFVIYGKDALEKFNVAVGRYVIMPDHVHFFVRGDPNFALSPWVGGLKRAISVAVSKDAVAARVACGIAERIGHQFAAGTAAATGETELFVAAGIF
jgi:REP element-mobilizing transposase RayT